MRTLITGAAGSGTSTLGSALASESDAAFFEADDFFWLPTSPPYQEKRPAQQRLLMALDSLRQNTRSVVSGSVMNWGEELEDSFTLIVFLQVETSVRLERIRRRELERFGHVNPAFLEWAAQYDDGPPEGRSLAKHSAWLETRRCCVLRLVGSLSTQEQIKAIKDAPLR